MKFTLKNFHSGSFDWFDNCRIISPTLMNQQRLNLFLSANNSIRMTSLKRFDEIIVLFFSIIPSRNNWEQIVLVSSEMNIQFDGWTISAGDQNLLFLNYNTCWVSINKFLSNENMLVGLRDHLEIFTVNKICQRWTVIEAVSKKIISNLFFWNNKMML